jgi:N-dimethylarginine dimethylaminohydrolase
MGQPRFLMCRPTFFKVSYVINPWMKLSDQPDPARALRQWQALRRVLVQLGAEVCSVRPDPAQPDMTFTANAGFVHGPVFIPTRFRHSERAGETPHFARWFRRRGYRVVELPEGQRFEGAGDAVFIGKTLLAAFYKRTDIQTHEEIGRILDCRVISLELVTPEFYHLDTCFCPLDARSALYYPAAFDAYGRRVLRDQVPDLIEAPDEEAYRFACNAIVVGRDVVLPRDCPIVSAQLERRGFRTYPLDFSEFLKSGGSAHCLTLRVA